MQATAPFLLTAAMLAAGALGAPGAQAAESRAGQGAAWSESGEATWYGPRHAGHRTTSGERFDPERLTAAHSSLPMGTWLRVTVADTGASVIVRVNDREPPHGVRCIDLSHAAAARLGIVGRGVADVTLAQVSGPDDRSVEVAEAPEDAQPVEAQGVAARVHRASHVRHVSARHGRRHTHRVHL